VALVTRKATIYFQVDHRLTPDCLLNEGVTVDPKRKGYDFEGSVRSPALKEIVSKSESPLRLIDAEPVQIS
jgi:hypothetical protein